MFARSMLEGILAGAQGLLMLLFALAAFYFSWVLSRVRPDRASRWFFGTMAVTMVLTAASFAMDFGLSAIYTVGIAIDFAIISLLTSTLSLLESLSWLGASVAMLCWAVARKRRLR